MTTMDRGNRRPPRASCSSLSHQRSPPVGQPGRCHHRAPRCSCPSSRWRRPQASRSCSSAAAVEARARCRAGGGDGGGVVVAVGARRDTPSVAQSISIRTWRVAETFAVSVLRGWGHSDASVTKSGADGGVDVRGCRCAGSGQAPGRGHGTSRYPASVRRPRCGDRDLYFFSLSGYSPQAVEYAQQHGVRLFSYSPTGQLRAPRAARTRSCRVPAAPATPAPPLLAGPDRRTEHPGRRGRGGRGVRGRGARRRRVRGVLLARRRTLRRPRWPGGVGRAVRDARRHVRRRPVAPVSPRPADSGPGAVPGHLRRTAHPRRRDRGLRGPAEVAGR